MNHFSSIHFINLDHRKDRLDHIVQELETMGTDFDRVQRIDATYIKFFGILGCGKSHIKSLETFIQNGGTDLNDVCLILEDDFTFCNSKEKTEEQLNHFFKKVGINFDVLMLSCNILEKSGTEYSPSITRILRGQTLSGYAVTRKYAPTLLENFKAGVKMLETYGFSVHEYCVDIHIQKLQPNDRWYFIEPRIGKQMESYSDIEQTVKSYHC